MVMKKIIILTITFVLIVICGVQQYLIHKYEKSETEWIELEKLWREKLDTCMNRNERIYQQLYEFQDIRVKQLKGELPK